MKNYFDIYSRKISWNKERIELSILRVYYILEKFNKENLFIIIGIYYGKVLRLKE